MWPSEWSHARQRVPKCRDRDAKGAQRKGEPLGRADTRHGGQARRTPKERGRGRTHGSAPTSDGEGAASGAPTEDGRTEGRRGTPALRNGRTKGRPYGGPRTMRFVAERVSRAAATVGGEGAASGAPTEGGGPKAGAGRRRYEMGGQDARRHKGRGLGFGKAVTARLKPCPDGTYSREAVSRGARNSLCGSRP